LPSPMLPVSPCRRSASPRRPRGGRHDHLDLDLSGRSPIVYSPPRYISVWPFWRPKTADLGQPSCRRSRPPSNRLLDLVGLNGLMIASTSSPRPPRAPGRPAPSNPVMRPRCMRSARRRWRTTAVAESPGDMPPTPPGGGAKEEAALGTNRHPYREHVPVPQPHPSLRKRVRRSALRSSRFYFKHMMTFSPARPPSGAQAFSFRIWSISCRTCAGSRFVSCAHFVATRSS